jgi:hypothetical protein
VRTDFGNKAVDGSKPHLILLGGIQINMPPPMPDFFLPLDFEVRTEGEDTQYLMKSTFVHL